ncbi:hypothetical protein [Caulobacter sp. BP25]|uniref:hypothetical protein n=1 Tax=Caulobacter sp. BP25 TaxID=2048900 RepID=UPI000C12B336|nr:hypothetical protein [Caulobacter sp. BP25]PHY20796.1 hypothetical protein CSW59_06115 [Caulobacter sp. BP25]
MSRLPGILGEIADVAGVDAAVKLARARGGTAMKISGKPGGALAQIVGDDAALKIAELLGSIEYTIPMANLRGQKARRARARQLLAQNVPSSKVALIVDVHLRTVERLKRREREDPEPQLPLFDTPETQ